MVSEHELAQDGAALRRVCSWSAETGVWTVADDPLAEWKRLGLSGESMRPWAMVGQVGQGALGMTAMTGAGLHSALLCSRPDAGLAVLLAPLICCMVSATSPRCSPALPIPSPACLLLCCRW